MLARSSIIVCGCSLSLVVLILYTNTGILHHNNNNTDQDITDQDNTEEQSDKKHFQFSIPVWEHGTTCAFRDNRSVCKQCITKVTRIVLSLVEPSYKAGFFLGLTQGNIRQGEGRCNTGMVLNPWSCVTKEKLPIICFVYFPA